MTMLPFVAAFLTAMAVIVWVGISLSRPELSVYLLLGIFIAFTGSSYGQLEAARTIYSRGTGQLHFSLINIFLFGIALVICINNAFSYKKNQLTPLAKYFWFFVVLMACNVLYVLAANDPTLGILDVFSYRGLLNVVNMGLLFYVCINTFDTTTKLKHLTNFLLLAIALRGVFGMVRWAFFGGDPANVYDNVEMTGTKLTFFDISDGFLAMFAMFVSAWQLYFKRSTLSRSTTLLLVLLFALEAAILVLSFRRSSLISLGLSAMVLVALLPMKQRIWAMALSALGLMGAVTALNAMRLAKVRSSKGSDLGFFYDLFGSGNGLESSSRVLEYTETWHSLGDYWAFGLGMWGTMKTSLQALSYHGGDFSFVHSGFGHVLLKSGLVGLLVFLGLLLSFTSFYLRQRATLSIENKMIADVGFAGMLFWIPTLLIGTPIIEFRSMMLLGFALAMPFMAARANTTHNDDIT